MSIVKPEKPELLAPAGNLNCALAAYNSGADAVYAGVSRFNAREMGENFSWDDMSRLSAYSKKLNRRFYLTLNTLVKENELEDFGDAVSRIAELAPDAVIVQDIGVIRFLREYFPKLTIHASTQMGIHNSAGVRAAASMGIERVILERQVTLDELKSICHEPVEIEVFIHGALCCSISGHCLFSSWLGGWSGNRGRCKQPCRRRFHGEEGGTKKSGFFFSTQDFYSLDMLDSLTEAGVCSLKIEGRLKKPDYVKNVVTAYRMMLDAPAADRPVVLKEARSILAGSYGRKWSHGFSSPEDMKELIQFSSAGVSGRLAATVEKTSKSGFEASVIQRLHIGDRIRIQPRSGDEGPSITITKMSAGRQSVNTAAKGSRVFIHCDKDVAPRSMIYKIGESRAETVKRPADLPLYAPPLKLDIHIEATAAGLTVKAQNPASNNEPLVWQQQEAIESAANRPLNAETLIEAFITTRNSAIDAGRITAETEDGLFLPAGRLKKARRAFWEWLESLPEIITAVENRNSSADAGWKERLKKDIALSKSSAAAEPLPAAVFAGSASLGADSPGSDIIVMPLADFINRNTAATGNTEIILPFFCPEEKLQQLSDMIGLAWERGIRRFRITSIYQLDLLKHHRDDNLTMSASFPLPAANSLAAKELADHGVTRAQIWLELDEQAVKSAAENWPVTAEIYRRGKPFLLATRADVAISGKISDSRGKDFTVRQPPSPWLDTSGGLTFVYPEEVLVLPELKDTADYYELKEVTGREKESGFNHDFTLI